MPAPSVYTSARGYSDALTGVGIDLADFSRLNEGRLGCRRTLPLFRTLNTCERTKKSVRSNDEWEDVSASLLGPLLGMRCVRRGNYRPRRQRRPRGRPGLGVNRGSLIARPHRPTKPRGANCYAPTAHQWSRVLQVVPRPGRFCGTYSLLEVVGTSSWAERRTNAPSCPVTELQKNAHFTPRI